jgi:hypothetical protein
MKPRLTEAVADEVKREKKLRQERKNWQEEHPKPWYLQ